MAGKAEMAGNREKIFLHPFHSDSLLFYITLGGCTYRYMQGE